MFKLILGEIGFLFEVSMWKKDAMSCMTFQFVICCCLSINNTIIYFYLQMNVLKKKHPFCCFCVISRILSETTKCSINIKYLKKVTYYSPRIAEIRTKNWKFHENVQKLCCVQCRIVGFRMYDCCYQHFF